MEAAPQLYVPTPKQARFHDSIATQRLYGGAAGGGKSRALRMEAVRQCESAPGVTGLLMRRTYPELWKSVISKLLEELPYGSYRYVKQDRCMYFPNGSRVEFGYCERETDVTRYQGGEYDFIGIDELTHMTEYMYRYMRSRLRTSKKNVLPNFFASTNPGGVGHAFVKKLWIDRAGYGERDKPEEYDFIPARVYDNPYNNPEYIDELEQLPDDERRALLEGDWDVFSGQYFREWRREMHVVDPFPIPATARRVIGIDYGYSAPSAVLWLAEIGESVYVYRELYGPGMTYTQLANEVVKRTPENELISQIPVDPAIFAKNPDTAFSGADRFKQAGLRVSPANNERVAGWQVVREWVHPTFNPNAERDTPKLYVFSNCVNLIRTLPSMIHDKTHVEDLDTRGEDHACDALRYAAMSIAKKPAKLTTVKKENDEAVRDPEELISNQQF